jgi:integrase
MAEELGTKEIRVLRGRDIDAFYDELRSRGLCPTSVRRCHAVLSAALNVWSNARDYSQPLKPGRITSRFSTLRKEANLKQIRLHDLRHFAATMMLAGGVDVRQTAPHTDKGLTL